MKDSTTVVVWRYKWKGHCMKMWMEEPPSVVVWRWGWKGQQASLYEGGNGIQKHITCWNNQRRPYISTLRRHKVGTLFNLSTWSCLFQCARFKNKEVLYNFCKSDNKNIRVIEKYLSDTDVETGGKKASKCFLWVQFLRSTFLRVKLHRVLLLMRIKHYIGFVAKHFPTKENLSLFNRESNGDMWTKKVN